MFELSAIHFEVPAIHFEFSAIHFEFSASPFEFSANSIWVFRQQCLSFPQSLFEFPQSAFEFSANPFEFFAIKVWRERGNPHFWSNHPRGRILHETKLLPKYQTSLEMTSMIQKFRIRSTWFGGEKQLNKFFRKRRQHMELSTVPHNVERNGRWEEEGKKKFTHSVKLW